MTQAHNSKQGRPYGAFLMLAGIMAGHTFMETARDAMFLMGLPAARLPYMYLLVAAGSLLVARAHRHCDQYQSSEVLGGYLTMSTVVTFVLWWVSAWSHPAVLYALYIWTGLYATAIVTQFWLVVSHSYTITQAKRVYGFIGAGGVTGAIAGAGASRLLAEVSEPRTLLLAAALSLTVCAGATRWGLRPTDVQPAPAPAAAGDTPMRQWRRVMGGRYLRLVAALVLLATATMTGVDYLFKSAAARLVEPEALATFFATVNLSLNTSSLVVQLLLTPWLLRKVGVNRALTVLPLLLVGGATALAVGGGLLAALALVSSERTFKHTVHQTSVELLYVPLTERLRTRVKALIDGLAKRLGQAITSMGILAAVAVGMPESDIAWVVAALAGAWLTVALLLRREYVALFRANLGRGRIQGGAHLPVLDVTSLETLIRALNSEDDAEVLAALSLLEEEGKLDLVPALILHHPSSDVVLAALQRFEAARRDDVVGVAARLKEHPDWRVRAAALRARAHITGDLSVYSGGSEDAHPGVRATAQVGLALARGDQEAKISGMVCEGCGETRLAVVLALSGHRGALVERHLNELANAPEVEVRVNAAEAMALAPSEAYFPALLEMLAQRSVRGAARQAFVAGGRAALDFLATALSDTNVEHRVRRHVPRTISRFRAEWASPILVDRLLKEQDGMVRYKILRGLGRIHTDHPSARLDRKRLQEAADQTLRRIAAHLRWQAALEAGAQGHPERATDSGRLLAGQLRDKVNKATERLLRLMALLHPHEDIERSWRGLSSRAATVRASARELLEHALEGPLRSQVLALVDESSAEEKLAEIDSYAADHLPTYERALSELLAQRSDSLRSLAAYHVAELGLDDFRPELQALEREPSPLLSDVGREALRRLLAPRPTPALGAS